MDYNVVVVKDKIEDPSLLVGKDVSEPVPSSSPGNVGVNLNDPKCGESNAVGAQSGVDTSGEVNMEALITSDDIIRAGGFGARDDIGCFLPVASDSTDFEASLRDAREYEEPQGETCRPGLGWKEMTKSE